MLMALCLFKIDYLPMKPKLQNTESHKQQNTEEFSLIKNCMDLTYFTNLTWSHLVLVHCMMSCTDSEATVRSYIYTYIYCM